MKILCIGDQHIQPANIPAIDIFLEKLEEYLKNNKIDVIFSLGDLLHTHEKIHAQALNKAIQYLTLLSSYAKTFVLVGNHDCEHNGHFLNEKHWLNCCKSEEKVIDHLVEKIKIDRLTNIHLEKNLIVVDKVTIYEIEDYKFVMCPYVPEGRFIEALDTKKGEWEDATYIFAHQTFDGANMGCKIAEDTEKWNETFPQIISGHIHIKQWVQRNLYYTGSCMQHETADTGSKTLLCLDLDKNGNLDKNEQVDSKFWKEYEIDLHLPRKKIIHKDVNEIDDYVPKFKEHIKYSLKISGSQDDFNAFKKSLKHRELHELFEGRIVYDPKRADIALKKEKHQSVLNRPFENKTFIEYLREDIMNEGDKNLEIMFRNIVEGKTEKQEESEDEESEDEEADIDFGEDGE